MTPPPLILVADPDADSRRMIAALLTGRGHRVQTAATVEELMERARKVEPALVLLDTRLGEQHGAEACRELKKADETRRIPVLMVVPPLDGEHRKAFTAGADDFLTRPFLPEELTVRIDHVLRRESATAASHAVSLILSMVSAFESRCAGRRGEPGRVARMARRLGQRVGLTGDDLDSLFKGGMLRDIGMLKVPEEIVSKNGALTKEEFETLKLHTVWGEAMCSHVPALQSIAPIIRHHHEQPDGSGYPDGLKGEAIPLLARVVAVCDIFDALSSDRPYRQRMPTANVLKYIQEYANRGWLDPTLVEEFLLMYEEDYAGQAEPAREEAATSPS